MATFLTTIGLLGASLAGRVRDHRSIALNDLIAQGLGNPDPQELLSGQGAPMTLLTSILLANVFQLFFSGLYYLYNGVISCMVVADEWAKYSTHRKALRVSYPVGAQRSSYFLSLPYKYGIPLLATSSLLQWLISQSVFLIRTMNFDPTQTNTIANESDRVGFSPIGIIASFVLTLLMFVVLMLLSFVMIFPNGESSMPMTSTCSAAISAACHRPPADYDAWQLPVQWGVIPKEEGDAKLMIGHCSFTTSHDVMTPIEGNVYA